MVQRAEGVVLFALGTSITNTRTRTRYGGVWAPPTLCRKKRKRSFGTLPRFEWILCRARKSSWVKRCVSARHSSWSPMVWHFWMCPWLTKKREVHYVVYRNKAVVVVLCFICDDIHDNTWSIRPFGVVYALHLLAAIHILSMVLVKPDVPVVVPPLTSKR